MAETQTYSSGTPVDTLLGLLRNNALLEVKDFACFAVNMSTLEGSDTATRSVRDFEIT